MNAQTMIVCSRGRGCETVTMRAPRLDTRIEQLLRRANGQRFTLRGIAAALKMECGHESEPAQNVARIAFHLARLEEREVIRFAAPDAHWIGPPRAEEHDPITGEVRR